MSESTKTVIPAKAGIQKTSGLMPKLRFPEFRDAGEWQPDSIDNVCTTYSGGTPTSSIKRFYGGSIPFIRSAEIDKKSTELLLTPEGLNKSSAKMVQKGDILYALYGANSGDVAIAHLDGAINQAILCMRSTSSNNFIFQYLSNNKDRIVSKYVQGGQGNLSGDIVKSITIPFPKAAEQQKIADCLSSLDALIAAHTDKLAALKTHKQGLLQQLFPRDGETVPRLRFTEFRASDEWHPTRLIDVADKKVRWGFIGGPFGSNLKASDYVEDGVRVIQLQNIGDAEFVDGYKIFTSEQKADELLSNNIYPGDIILSKMGDPVGRACLIPATSNRYVMCSDGIRLAVDQTKNCKYFIYSLINAPQFRSLVERTATGSTRKRIGLDQLKNLRMLLPQKAEQQKIADCLSSLDTLIVAQADKIAALKQHKQGLLQQLFPAMDEAAA